MASLEVVRKKSAMVLLPMVVVVSLALFEAVVATDALPDKTVVPFIALAVVVVVVVVSTSKVSLLVVSITREVVADVGV
jgi:hypothetical protein